MEAGIRAPLKRRLEQDVIQPSLNLNKQIIDINLINTLFNDFPVFNYITESVDENPIPIVTTHKYNLRPRKQRIVTDEENRVLQNELIVKYNLNDEYKMKLEGLSPIAKSIVLNINTDPKNLIDSLIADSVLAEKISELSNYDDEDYYYEDYDKSMIDIGFKMEYFLSNYMLCPVCRENTLKKYIKDNMPIVDLICVNTNHKQGTRYFQVKTKKIGSKYFDIKNKIIHVGSYKFGSLVHEDHNEFTPGYILVELDEELKLNIHKSIVILPNKRLIDLSRRNCYGYLDISPRNNILKFNPEYCFINRLGEYLTNYNFRSNISYNGNIISKLNTFNDYKLGKALDFEDL